MTLEIPCPYDEMPLTVEIDTTGDPSVGIGPDGVEQITGSCRHVGAFNASLEDDGEDALNADWPALAARILGAVEKLAEDEAAAMERAETADCPTCGTWCAPCGRATCHCGEHDAPALHHVKLTGGPSRRTQWSYFVENPQGGGSGTNAGAGVSLAAAWGRAVARHTGLPAGTVYRLSVNDQDRGLQTRGQEPWA